MSSGADRVYAFPMKGSRGTWDCVRRAEKAGIPVTVFDHPADYKADLFD